MPLPKESAAPPAAHSSGLLRISLTVHVFFLPSFFIITDAALQYFCGTCDKASFFQRSPDKNPFFAKKKSSFLSSFCMCTWFLRRGLRAIAGRGRRLRRCSFPSLPSLPVASAAKRRKKEGPPRSSFTHSPAHLPLAEKDEEERKGKRKEARKEGRKAKKGAFNGGKKPH